VTVHWVSKGILINTNYGIINVWEILDYPIQEGSRSLLTVLMIMKLNFYLWLISHVHRKEY